MNECVNCLCNSILNNGSDGMSIKISRSANSAATKPVNAAGRNLSLCAADCDAAAPTSPWVNGSINRSLQIFCLVRLMGGSLLIYTTPGPSYYRRGDCFNIYFPKRWSSLFINHFFSKGISSCSPNDPPSVRLRDDTEIPSKRTSLSPASVSSSNDLAMDEISFLLLVY